VRIVETIRRYATHHGKPDRYHETLTQAWVRLVEHAGETGIPLDSLVKETIGRYYSEGLLATDEARKTFVAPDREALP
jgi:hypothetical protein